MPYKRLRYKCYDLQCHKARRTMTSIVPYKSFVGLRSDADHQHILSLLDKQPDITCLEIIETLDLPVSIDTVWRFLQKAGYRRKKKSLHASEQERPRCGAEEKRLERPYIWIQGK